MLAPMKDQENPSLVTIGLLTYNNEDTLVRALESLVHQDYTAKELVIIDDVSTDRTYDICQSYAQQYGFIRLFRNEKNVGCFQNLEHLLQKVKGDFFLWACPDDVYDLDFLSACVGAMHKDVIMATSAVKVLYDDDRVITCSYHELTKSNSFWRMAKMIVKTQDSNGERVYYNSILHTLMRTEFLDKIYNVHQLFCCEELWVINALIWGRVAYVDHVLVKKYESTVSYEIRNPHYHKAVSNPFARLFHAMAYLFVFLCKSMPLQKKWRYVQAFYLVIAYRLPHLALLAIKGRLLHLDALLFSSWGHKMYQKMGWSRHAKKNV
ncbi:glycosyltransferase family 2 protein [bacterium NHP-B]|nr:glycosyltransferase family 2 protein [bacterium NHP-B]